MLIFLLIIVGNFLIFIDENLESKLSIIMAVYIKMYLAGIIFNLNFELDCNEIYGTNRSSILEPGGLKKVCSDTGELATLPCSNIFRSVHQL